MPRLTYIPRRVIDINGIADGATVYVYQSGTTTLVNLYSDVAGTIPIANPYSVAVGAMIPPIYYTYTGNVRLYIVSASGSIDDQDPYPSYVLTTDLSSLAPAAVADRTTMAALVSPIAGQTRYLLEAGREGVFKFDNSNLSTQVSADTQQGIYVAPAAASTGASGAWVRQFSGPHNIKWFGAKGDDVTNDSVAFTSAISYFRAIGQTGYGYSRGSPQLFVPKGKYFLGTTTLDITTTMVLFGEGGTGPQGPASLLRWSAGTTGIRLQAGNTTAASGTQTEDGTGADGSIIRNIGLIGGRVASDGAFHAIHFRTTASVRDLYIEKWEGDALFATCTAGSGGATEGSANCLQVDRIYVENVRRALYLDGGDVNAGRFAGIVLKGASQEGIFDSSFLGNSHIGHHVAAAVGAAYKSDGANARSVFVGCYSEGDSGASDIVTPSVVVGGLHGAGFTAGTTAPILGNAGIAFDYFGSGPSQFGQTRITFPTSSGYEIALNNSAAMSGGTYSTLRFEQGIESGTTPAALGAIRIRSTTASPATNEGIMEFQTRTFGGAGALTTRVNLDGPNLSWRPETDNNMDSGTTSFRWKTFWGYTGNFATSIVVNGVTVIDNTSRLLAAAFPALTGDVTTAGGVLATTIANNAVTSVKINAAAVTYGKIQNVAATALLGNPTGAPASPSEITLAGGLGFSGTTLTINGAVSAATSVATSGALTSSSATAGVGYASGAKGTATQATSKSTGVTMNNATGDITLNGAALASATTVSFVLTDSAIGANDNLIINHITTGTFGAYTFNAHGFAAGSCTIDVTNRSAGSLSEAIVIRVTVIKGG